MAADLLRRRGSDAGVDMVADGSRYPTAHERAAWIEHAGYQDIARPGGGNQRAAMTSRCVSFGNSPGWLNASARSRRTSAQATG